MRYLCLLSLLVLYGCDHESKSKPTPAVNSTAVASNAFNSGVETDPFDEAYATLRRDAHRREARFLDALKPGHLFKTTRVEQSEIRNGQWPTEDLYRIGGQLFDLKFTKTEGLGTASVAEFRRVHSGDDANIDAARCAACHWRGGEAGAGDAADNVYFAGDGDRPSSALERNPPSLAGAGALELAGKALTAALHQRRDELITFTKTRGYSVRDAISAQGIPFGYLTVYPDGTVDTNELSGVDSDLVIKPFGRKGRFAELREMVEYSLSSHHGLQTEWAVQHWSRAQLGTGPAEDPDNDGVIREITEGQVTALTVYLAMQGLPTIEPPSDARLMTKWARGRRVFDSVGCATCHTPKIELDTASYVLRDREADDEIAIDLSVEGSPPRILPGTVDGHLTLRLFSDLRRHRMSSTMADNRDTEHIPADTFMTPPLWGLARSRPYMHDGRAPTIEDAILLHGGEAQSVRDAFEALPESEKSALRTFLTSLNRAQRFTAR